MLYLFPTAVSLCACRHSNEEYCFYTTFERITSREVAIRGSMFQNRTNSLKSMTMLFEQIDGHE